VLFQEKPLPGDDREGVFCFPMAGERPDSRSLMMRFRVAEFLRAGDLSCKLVGGMDQDRKALRTNPDLSTHELQCKQRNLLFRLLTMKAAFHFF